MKFIDTLSCGWYNIEIYGNDDTKMSSIDDVPQHIREMLEHLPHGSGIDADLSATIVSDDHVEVVLPYHKMNEVGMYDGWIDFFVTILRRKDGTWAVDKVFPSPEEDEGIADYIGDTVYYALTDLYKEDK